MAYDPSVTVKLVIWDLDHTFWVNTLDEEEILPIRKHLELVRKLNDHGVVNSICSKNDFEIAKKALQILGVWDEFTLPAIAWSSKGSMIASIIDSFSLRAENVLFIDDNEMNLREAEYYNPKIQTLNCTVNSITETLEEIIQKSKPDSRKRFNQYKVLEKKVADKIAFDDNTQFLRQSGVTISFSDDCETYIDRIEELVNRTNQLNFTKLRMQKDDLLSMINDRAYRCFVLFVRDNYGDYGLAGFVCLSKKSNRLMHFVFSCRIMNMGVENYVWSMLGYPHCEVVGDVSATLSKGEVPDWIKVTSLQDGAVKTVDTKRILLIGGCDLSQMHHYLRNAKSIETYFNFPSLVYNSELHRDSINFLHASTFASKEIKQFILDEFPLSHPDFFQLPELSVYDTIIYSPLIDYVQSEYYSVLNSSITVSYGDFLDAGSAMDSTRKELLEIGVENEKVERFCSKWRTDGPISGEMFLLKLHALFRGFKGKLIILTAAEKKYPIYHSQIVPRHKYMNSIVRKFADERCNTAVIELDDFLEGEESFTNSIRHYTREVYYKLATAIEDALQKNTSLETVIPQSVLHFAIVPLDGERNYKYRYFYRLTESENPILQPTPFGFNEDTESAIKRLLETGFKQVDSRQRRILQEHTALFNRLQTLTIQGIPFSQIISYEKVSLLPYVSTATYSSKVTEVMEIAEYMSNLISAAVPEKTVIYGNPEDHQIETLLEILKQYRLTAITCGMQWGTAIDASNATNDVSVQSGDRDAIQKFCRQFRSKAERGGKPLVLFISYPSAISFLPDGTMSDRFYDVYRDYFLARGFHVIRIELPYYFQISGDKEEYFRQTQLSIRSGYETILFDDFKAPHRNTNGSLNEKFRIFSQSTEFLEAMQHNGISVFSPLFDYWRYIFTDYLSLCIDMIHGARELLHELKPAYFFASYEVGDYARSLIIEAHRAGICSFGTQHGFIFPEHEYYLENNQNNHADLTTGFYGYLSPTITLLYGSLHKEILTKVGSYTEQSVAVMGDWRVLGKSISQSPSEVYNTKERYFPGNRKKVALLLTSGLSSGIASDMIRILGPEEYMILIKLHPNDMNQDRVVSPFIEAGFTVQAVRDNLYGCIAIADLIFTSAYSSVVPECLTLGKVPICKDDFDAGYTLPWKNIIFDIQDYPDAYLSQVQSHLDDAKVQLHAWGMESGYNFSLFCSRLSDALIKADSFYGRIPIPEIVKDIHESENRVVSEKLSIILLVRNNAAFTDQEAGILQTALKGNNSLIFLCENDTSQFEILKLIPDAMIYTVDRGESMTAALNRVITESSANRILLVESEILPKRSSTVLPFLLHDKSAQKPESADDKYSLKDIMVAPLTNFSGIEINKSITEFSGFDETYYDVAPWEMLVRNIESNTVDYYTSLGTVYSQYHNQLTTSLGIVKTVNRHIDSFLGVIGHAATANILSQALSLIEGINSNDATVLRSTVTTLIENLFRKEQINNRKVH